MPYLVNGKAVPEELVRKESERIARDLCWRDIPDEAAGKSLAVVRR
jgi:hypothetical protein